MTVDPVCAVAFLRKQAWGPRARVSLWPRQDPVWSTSGGFHSSSVTAEEPATTTPTPSAIGWQLSTPMTCSGTTHQQHNHTPTTQPQTPHTVTSNNTTDSTHYNNQKPNHTTDSTHCNIQQHNHTTTQQTPHTVRPNNTPTHRLHTCNSRYRSAVCVLSCSKPKFQMDTLSQRNLISRCRVCKKQL